MNKDREIVTSGYEKHHKRAANVRQVSKKRKTNKKERLYRMVMGEQTSMLNTKEHKHRRGDEPNENKIAFSEINESLLFNGMKHKSSVYAGTILLHMHPFM